MSPETAQTVVIAIATILATTWVGALVAMLHATRNASADQGDEAGRYEIETAPKTSQIAGKIEVEGTPAAISEKLQAVLVQGVFGPFGRVEITSASAREVAFEGRGMTSKPRSGRFRLSPLGSRTLIDYAIDSSGGRAILLTLGWSFLGIGLVILVLLAWLQFRVVLPSPNPRTRVQSVQMIQAIHCIWPPYLFAYLSGRAGRFARSAVDAVLRQRPNTKSAL